MEPKLIAIPTEELQYKSTVLTVVSKNLLFSPSVSDRFPGLYNFCKVHMGRLFPVVLRYEYKANVIYVCIVKFEWSALKRTPVKYQLEDAYTQVVKMAKLHDEEEIYCDEANEWESLAWMKSYLHQRLS